ncbi:tyrosine-type recombinase/integrase [Tuwongella immobilis]|uniref:Tyr recombinase domain-containing protein n=1 Tax=Tuwongella immobilis TaxID=692036 RepID=A0A6C2YWQ8_9BACT|nr:tyrosine-type recombinase/integrase [Tuwongella immobilis]VIP05349.1 integrase : Phage integrase family protein OS=Rhodopirellula europaea 6C GN=RE6C_02840 PE=4 SV=1: Phage_int_SAM_4: Phage_integrase [Tuwongella immobilis]VTS08054.1 integrase : Phage integrase family protein OS=Rhodopirellula europaea 6C GN=RE6C_02840 PE=4 SV=1: Phage_int_SAM_4: Phage_integrase [Tuwongella immobilis]
MMIDHQLTSRNKHEILPFEEIDSFRRACDDFFAGRIANSHTRKAYLRAARQFFAWCDTRGVPPKGVTAGLIARYFNERGWAVPTEKQHLAALRSLFDHLVAERLLDINPAASVRRARYSQDEGKTAEITTAEVRRLLSTIDTSNVLGLRDRAIIGVLNFTGARVGAIAALRLGDIRDDGSITTLHFREKNGKRRAVPVRPDLESWLRAYQHAADIDCDPRMNRDAPLFRCVQWDKSSRRLITNKSNMTPEYMRRMIKRRCKAANLSERITPHSFRVKTVTTLLQAGQPLEDVQYLVGHADPRTTRLYDRRKKRVTWDLVNSIPG